MASPSGMEPGPQCWEASAFTTGYPYSPKKSELIIPQILKCFAVVSLFLNRHFSNITVLSKVFFVYL